uniref:Helitron helicase-like domain-containing protein n=1 Tax=Brassica oleracea TaxID=3712 RepID=A0A3P6E676_BRAOL|nr:unnamed protein product [Brassica oleracea]
MQRIQRVLPLDSWGVIELVTVTPAGGQYRTTNYKYKMVIAEDAVLSRSDLVDDRIFLSLANYEEIENGTKKPAFLIVNPYVKKFRSARDRFNTDPENSFHMRIVSERLKDGRTYNTPTASEVAALISGDFSLDMDRRDIVLQKNGFRLGIKKGATEKTKKQKKPNISMRQWFAFRLHERKNESHSLVHSRRIFQQFVVDAFTTIESNRLRYLKVNQPSLSDSYDSIKESENARKVDMNEQGTEFTLPASFVGSHRYMKSCYLDAMAICLMLSDDDKKKYALFEIEKILKRYGTSLAKFDSMPRPPKTSSHDENVLVLDERS